MNLKRALLLSGGAALGAVDQIILENLVSLHGYESYKAVNGVSVGALNGILFAQRRLERLRELYSQIESISYFMKPNWFAFNKGIYSLNPLKERLIKEFRQSRISPETIYSCGVFDLQAERYWSVPHTVHESTESLIETIIASCAQPVIMAGNVCHVNKYLKRYCVDGGVRHIIPTLSDWETYDAIDVILTSPINRRNMKLQTNLNSLIQIIGRIVESQIDNVVLSDLHRLELYSYKVPVTLYAPKESGNQFDASHKTMMWRLNKVGMEMWKNPIKLYKTGTLVQR